MFIVIGMEIYANELSLNSTQSKVFVIGMKATIEEAKELMERSFMEYDYDTLLKSLNNESSNSICIDKENQKFNSDAIDYMSACYCNADDESVDNGTYFEYTVSIFEI